MLNATQYQHQRRISIRGAALICIFSSRQHGNLLKFNQPLRKSINIYSNYLKHFNRNFYQIHRTLLENLDVNRFDSRVTLYNANNAGTIVNTTSSLLDFYTLWNQTSHTQQPSGFNLAAVIKKIREVGAQILNEERGKSRASGHSFVALVVPQLSAVNDGDSNFVAEQLVSIRERNPDLKLLFWAGGSHGRFSRYVQDQNRDLFPLMAFSSSGDSGQQVNQYTQPVIKRIKEGTKPKSDKMIFSSPTHIILNFQFHDA